MNYKNRQLEIVIKAAEHANGLPLQHSGLWFHHDIRDNFYYASYLFTAAADNKERISFDAASAIRKAEAVLLKLLSLQDGSPESVTYGHWPLNLEPSPEKARPNPLPVELMGSLMAYFTKTYKAQLSDTLREALESALKHVYHSGFYRQTNVFGHHDAKYTAAKLIFGQWFGDARLMEDGRSNLVLTLARVRTYGMSEYGSLPWFWHWVQAFTCAWQMENDPSVKEIIGELLDYLWNERAAFYLKGAWAGAHSRGQRHDIPKDGNVWLDYVQFGDFKLPEDMPRTEYAGLLYYEAPEQARRTALHRSEPAEVLKRVTKQMDAGPVQLHSYAYMTQYYAAGGMWERFEEFDNEQHRWDITLPLDAVEGVNQAYFFHPSGEKSHEDPRHQSPHSEVLFNKNVVIALFPIPEGFPGQIIGVLPKAGWLQEPKLLLGQTGAVYWAIHLLQDFKLDSLKDRCAVTSSGQQNGVVIEVLDAETAGKLGLDSFEAFAAAARLTRPEWRIGNGLSVRYISMQSAEHVLSLDSGELTERTINGLEVDFTRYTV